MSNSSIWPINWPLSSAPSPDESEPGNENVFHIPQSTRTGALPSDCLVSYPGHSLMDFYPSSEMKLIYSIAPVDSAGKKKDEKMWKLKKSIRNKEA